MTIKLTKKGAFGAAFLMLMVSHFLDAGDKDGKKLDKEGFGGGGSGARAGIEARGGSDAR